MDKFIGDHKSLLWLLAAILSAIAVLVMQASGVSLMGWLSSSEILMNSQQHALLTSWLLTFICLGMWLDTGGKYWLLQKSREENPLPNTLLCFSFLLLMSLTIHMVASGMSLVEMQSNRILHFGLMIASVIGVIGMFVDAHWSNRVHQ